MKALKSLQLIDKPTFFDSLSLLVAETVPLIVYPDHGAACASGFMLFITFSNIGQIKLGDPDEEPEFSTVSWRPSNIPGSARRPPES